MTAHAWFLRSTVVLLLAVVAVAASGCQRFSRAPAAIPSNQMTPVVWNADTAAVLSKGLDTGGKVLASTLEQNTEAGSVIYVNYDGWVYNPDGTLFLDKDGKPIRLQYEVVAKLNSLKELATMEGVEEVDYIVGGFGYLKDQPDGVKGADPKPEALRLHIKGVNKLAATDTTAQNRDAAGRERRAIFDGMAELARVRGAAFAIGATALADGMVKVITAGGKEIIGRCTGTYAVDALVTGASRITESVITAKDGTQTKVVAEGDTSAAIQAALQ